MRTAASRPTSAERLSFAELNSHLQHTSPHLSLCLAKPAAWCSDDAAAAHGRPRRRQRRCRQCAARSRQLVPVHAAAHLCRLPGQDATAGGCGPGAGHQGLPDGDAHVQPQRRRRRPQSPGVFWLCLAAGPLWACLHSLLLLGHWSPPDVPADHGGVVCVPSPVGGCLPRRAGGQRRGAGEVRDDQAAPPDIRRGGRGRGQGQGAWVGTAHRAWCAVTSLTTSVPVSRPPGPCRPHESPPVPAPGTPRHPGAPQVRPASDPSVRSFPPSRSRPPARVSALRPPQERAVLAAGPEGAAEDQPVQGAPGQAGVPAQLLPCAQQHAQRLRAARPGAPRRRRLPPSPRLRPAPGRAPAAGQQPGLHHPLPPGRAPGVRDGVLLHQPGVRCGASSLPCPV